MCAKQYSNSELGIIGRSLKIEDLEKQFSSTGEQAKTDYINTQISALSTSTYIKSINKSDNTVTYQTSYSHYPDIYQYENGSGINTTTVKTDGIGLSDIYSNDSDYIGGITAKSANNANTNGLTVKFTYYYMRNTPETYFVNSTFHEMIFGASKAYWLASRCVSATTESAFFYLRRVSIENLTDYELFYSNGTGGGSGYAIRPVVTLPSNVILSETGGSADTPRTLSNTNSN